MRGVTKWVAAVVAAAGLTVTAGTASAAGPVGPLHTNAPRHDTDYVVQVRSGWHGQWRFHGRYETLHQAQRAERALERQGYRVRIEPVFGGRPHTW